MTNGHPKGLHVLFYTEMWERFSYYGMRAILVLYMTKALMFDVARASTIYGNFTGLAYLMPLAGGYIADRWWGNRRSILAGGVLMACGQFLIFASASFWADAALAVPLLWAGLGVLIVGTGLFKANIASMVGSLYAPDDRRKDSAFTIFYMGINIGAFLSPLIAGGLGDTGDPADFRWGFLAAAVGMVIGTIIFQLNKDRHVVDAEGRPLGLPPSDHRGGGRGADHDKPLVREDWERVAVIFILSFFVIFFWMAFEQAGASLTVFADRQTDRDLLGWTVPASWFQSVNAVAIVLFAPVFAWLWQLLGRRRLDPPTPVKMSLGFVFLALGYLVIAFGVDGVDPATKVSMMWLIGPLPAAHLRRALPVAHRAVGRQQAVAAPLRLADDGRVVPGVIHGQQDGRGAQQLLSRAGQAGAGAAGARDHRPPRVLPDLRFHVRGGGRGAVPAGPAHRQVEPWQGLGACGDSTTPARTCPRPAGGEHFRPGRVVERFNRPIHRPRSRNR